MNTDRDRLLKENEDEARRIKEELLGLRGAMLRHENALNALAIERTNLEADSDDERIEILPEPQAFVPTYATANARPIWPKAALGVVALVGIVLGLGALGIFNNGSNVPVAHRAISSATNNIVPPERKANVPLDHTLTRPMTHVRSNKVPKVSENESMSILPGITYTSEISYSMKSSTVTLVEVRDKPMTTLHLSHAPQSFFIPLKTAFRIDSEGADQRNGRLMVLTDTRKHDLEIRFEPPRLPLERKNLGVSSSQ